MVLGKLASAGERFCAAADPFRVQGLGCVFRVRSSGFIRLVRVPPLVKRVWTPNQNECRLTQTTLMQTARSFGWPVRRPKCWARFRLIYSYVPSQ
jgi:hypothetical protein